MLSIFSQQNAIYFTISILVHELFTFYIKDELNFKCLNLSAKG